MQTKENISATWDRFVHIFWALFFIKLIMKLLAGALPTTEAVYGVALLQIPIVIVMAWSMGRTAYKFTGRTSSYLYGAFGFFWLGFVGIFVGYVVIKGTRNRAFSNIGVEAHSKNAGFFSRLLD